MEFKNTNIHSTHTYGRAQPRILRKRTSQWMNDWSGNRRKPPITNNISDRRLFCHFTFPIAAGMSIHLSHETHTIYLYTDYNNILNVNNAPGCWDLNCAAIQSTVDFALCAHFLHCILVLSLLLFQIVIECYRQPEVDLVMTTDTVHDTINCKLKQMKCVFFFFLMTNVVECALHTNPALITLQQKYILMAASI